ncbi:MAG TPA: DUF6311 domain-containing protein, partial [Cyclobacteriaceae bacterium]
MKKLTFLSSRFFYLLLSLIILIVFYHHRWGLGVFNGAYVNWVIDDSELANVFFSFGFYRHQELVFPIGKVNAYFYPIGTNIYTTDIPLLALIFKPLSPILPKEFQYIGIWYLVCHLLQAWFTILLCERFSIKGFSKFLVIAFLMFTPLLMSRYIHCSLFCQWMILAAIWIYFLDPDKYSVKKILFFQFLLFISSGLEFAYMWAMVFGFSVALFIRLWYIDKKLKLYEAIGYFTLHMTIMVGIWILVGLFSFEGIPDYQMPGWGQFSLNINSLYNPMGTGTIMPTFPHTVHQQLEGYAYLGLGILILIFISMVYYALKFFTNKRSTVSYQLTIAGVHIWPLILFFAFATCYSLSSTIMFNTTIIFNYEIGGMFTKWVNSFRSSGRFFWPVYYFIIIISFYYFNRINVNVAVRNSILTSCLVLQLYDIQYYFKPRDINYATYKPPINDVWDKLIAFYDNIAFYPGYRKSYLSFDDYRYFTYYAVKHQKNINVGYPARFDAAKTEALNKEMGERISIEGLDEHTLYISFKRDLNRLAIPVYDNDAYCYNVDGYIAIFKKTKNNEPLAQYLDQAVGADYRNILMGDVTPQPWDGKEDSIITKDVNTAFYERDYSDSHLFLKGFGF